MLDDEATDASRAIEITFGLIGEFPGGSTFAAILQQWPAIQRIQAQAMLHDLIEALDDSEYGLLQRMRQDERVLRLLWDASNAAANADTTAKIRALAHVAVSGLQDDAKLDEASYVIGTIRELQVIDVRLLLALEAANPMPEIGLDSAHALGVSAGVGQSLNAKLLRLALVETGGMSFTGIHSTARLSTYGQEILTVLREHGGGNPLQ